jgi:hypothetical protein
MIFGEGIMIKKKFERDCFLLELQIIGILCIFAWCTVNMVPFFYLFKFFGILRISAEEEQAGLDASKHGGSAYNYEGGLPGPPKKGDREPAGALRLVLDKASGKPAPVPAEPA